MPFAPYNPVCYLRLPNARGQTVRRTPAIFKEMTREAGLDDDVSVEAVGGKLNLWTYDSQHRSNAGYILAALVMFGQLTGHDPVSLGDREHVAADLGLSPQQMHALEEVAHDKLAAHA
jgi:hypothetical protein